MAHVQPRTVSPRGGLSTRGAAAPAPAAPAMEPLEPRLLLDANLLITEFMATNQSTRFIPTDPTSTWDWIEVYNPTASAVNLGGWSLADENHVWPTPAVDIQPNQYLVFYASGNTALGAYHTNFKLDGDGEYLGLLGPGGAEVHAYDPFPEQLPDVSYGLPLVTSVYEDLVVAGAAASYHVPTPGDDVLAWTALDYTGPGWVDTFAVDPAGVVITEIATGDADWVELQNVSAGSVDTTGWFVAVNDASAGNVNAVNPTVWWLPGTMGAGEVRYRTDDAGDPAYWGGDIAWDPAWPGWAMVVDAAGQVVDFVAWGYTAGQVASLDASAGGFAHLTAAGHWTGDGAEVGTSQPGGTTFVAFNDHYVGAGTHANATTYAANGTSAGPLKDIETGLATAATLTITQVGTSYEGTQGSPSPGTDAYEIFNGYVDFSGPSGSTASLALSGAAWYRHTFTGLDTGDEVTYDIVASAVRGGDGYTNRWTCIKLEGAESATAAHSTGTGVVVLSATEVAIWTGENFRPDQGFVAAWTDIDPGPDGEFAIVSSQYTGTTPLGTANGSKGYGVTGLRLREFGLGGAREYLVRRGGADTDSADDFVCTGAATMGAQNPDLTVPFGQVLPVTTGIGYTDGDPDFEANIRTDVAAAMEGVNASLWIRIPFDAGELPPIDRLALRMQYDAGFIAYLNGEVVAQRNAPPSPAYDSAATAERENGQAVTVEEIDISDHILTALEDGPNVLAIHGLNSAAADNDFLIVPELVASGQLDDPEYMTTPTRGGENVAGAMGFVADTTFSIDRGFFTDAFEVTISTATSGATIYYTTDGTKPQPVPQQAYAGPVAIITTTTLRAMAHRPGWIATNVDTETYVFPEHVAVQTRPDGYPTSWGGEPVADYAVDQGISLSGQYDERFIQGLTAIPTLSLVLPMADMFGTAGLYSNPTNTALEKETSAELIYPDGREGFQIDAGLKIQGGASRNPGSAIKHSMSLRFRAIYGEGRLEFPLFDDWPVDRFNSLHLRAMYNNSWIHSDQGQRNRGSLIRDQWMRDTLIAMGQVDAANGIYVNLYINGLYWGVYNLEERADASHYAEYRGGDEDRIDALKSGVASDGTMASWNALQNQVATAAGDGTITLAEFQQIEQKLDMASFIDYMIVNHYGGNEDWDGHNWRAVGGGPDNVPWHIYSWDAERVLEGTTVNKIGVNNGGAPSRLFQNLRLSEEFRLLFADRLHKHFFNGGALTEEAAAARWMARADELDLAIVCESARWGDDRPGGPYTRDNQWMTEQQRLLDHYFLETNPAPSVVSRSEVMIRKPTAQYGTPGQYRSANLYPSVDAPVFNVGGAYQHGGAVAAGAALTMTGAGGTVYYTLDGTDPRLPGGALSPAAVAYVGTPLVLATGAHVRARARSGATWSALNEAVYVLDTPPEVVVTEVMFNPAPATAAEVAAGFTNNDDFEYIEIQNIGGQAVNLAGLEFADGVVFAFPTFVLGPGQFALVVRSIDAFEVRYGMGLSDRILGEFQWRTGLDNAAERLATRTVAGALVQEFELEDGWYDHTDGGGFSLVVRDPLQDRALWDSPDGWRPSWQPGGNPGAADAGTADPGDVVINEVVAHSNVDPQDWIELWNTTADRFIDIGGWFLSDAAADLLKYEITAAAMGGSTVLGPGEYVVFSETANFGQFAADPGRHTWFALSELGDQMYLTSQAPGGLAGGYRQDEDFGASDPDVSFGRYVKTTGGKDFVPVAAQTPGGPNAAPIIPDVVINEIMYQSATGGLEWIELYNRTGADVLLHDAEDPVNPWRFTAGVACSFPTDAYVPAWGYALVVPVAPATFRLAYGIPESVPIYGPYDGALENNGERLALSKPGVPEAPSPEYPEGYVPYIQVEKVRYNDEPSWPTAPAGQGPSLERLGAGAYGNDPANWAASLVAGGTPGAANSALPAALDWLGETDDHWENPANWSTPLVPGWDVSARLNGSGSHEPALYQDQAAKGLDFTSAGWTLGGAGFTLTVGAGGVGSVGAGTSTIRPDVALGADSTWTVGADNTLLLEGALDGLGHVLTKDGPGTLVLAAATGLGGLDVAAGTVRLAGGGAGVVVTAGLAIGPGATLDLADGNLVVDYTGGVSPYAAVAAWIASGYNAAGGGNWDGPGITSNAAAADPQRLTVLGVIDNQDPDPGIGGLADLEGVAVPAASVLVKYTWWGDANLDGKVDSNDYDKIDTAWLLGTPDPRWATGDFNYDGVIDSNDYDKIDTAWLLSGGGVLGGGGPVAASAPGVSGPVAAPALAPELVPAESDAAAPASLLAAADLSVLPAAPAISMTAAPVVPAAPVGGVAVLAAPVGAYSGVLTVVSPEPSWQEAEAWSGAAPDALGEGLGADGDVDLLAAVALDIGLGV